MDLISVPFHVEWSEGKRSLKESLSLESLLIHEYSCKERQVVGLFMLALFKKESIELVHEVHEHGDVARGFGELCYQFGLPSCLCLM